MKKLKSQLMMLITFIALPYYMIRSKILLKSNDSDKVGRELKRYGDDFLSIRGVNVEVIHEEGYLDLEKCVFVSNHQSHNDIFILLSALKTRFRFIAKKELFNSPIFRNFMKFSQSYPLDRDDDKASLLVLKQAVKDIKEDGASVVVFPEGTRSHGPDMGPFKVGLFSMLRRAQAPIVPVYIENSYQVGVKTYRVHIGNPIDPDGLSGSELTDKVLQEMTSIQKSLI